MKLINKLKEEVDEMLEINRLLGEIRKEWTYRSDTTDQKNYNQARADFLAKREAELLERLNEIYSKWF